MLFIVGLEAVLLPLCISLSHHEENTLLTMSNSFVIWHRRNIHLKLFMTRKIVCLYSVTDGEDEENLISVTRSLWWAILADSKSRKGQKQTYWTTSRKLALKRRLFIRDHEQSSMSKKKGNRWGGGGGGLNPCSFKSLRAFYPRPPIHQNPYGVRILKSVQNNWTISMFKP